MASPDFYIRNADTMAPAMHKFMSNELRFFPYKNYVLTLMELEDVYEENAILEEQVDELIAHRNELLDRLSAFGVDGSLLTLDQLDGGDCLREANDHLQEMARDIHHRGFVTKDRKVIITIIGAPSKGESARVDLDYDVEIKKPKSSGKGVGYLDASGNLVPVHKGVEQAMFDMNGNEEEKAAA